jgi:hypothetical protein
MDMNEESSATNAREFRFGFNSAGAPVYMSVVVQTSAAGAPLTAGVTAARFTSPRYGFHQKFTADSMLRVHIVADSGATPLKTGGESSALPEGGTPLSDAEFVLAGTLAK